LEDRMRQLNDLHIEIARRAAARTDLGLSGELNPRAGIHPSGDLDLERAAYAYPAVACTFNARIGDHRAVPVTDRTRPRRHHLTEERPLDLADLAPPSAGVARHRAGPRSGALALAGRARNRRVDLDLPRGSEGRLGQLNVEP